MKLQVYSDGASRGNPGVSAIAYMILDEENRMLKRKSTYLGVRTNNQAEYEALLTALQSASEFDDDEVECYLDSELVVKQLNGQYKVRNENLRVLWLKIQKHKQNFRKISFTYVPRTNSRIQEVDRLANLALDGIKKRM
jgi:ribonuclease HI